MRQWITCLESIILAALMAAPLSAKTTFATKDLTASPTALLRAAPPPSAYPDADIYWLRYEETVTLHADGKVQEDYHNTGRILNARGLENADVRIPYSAASQRVTGVQARTVRPDGTTLLVQAADIHETSPFSDFTLYDDAKNIAFSLPGVEAGVVIDYRYTILTRSPLQRGQFADAWWLGGADPSRLNRYTLIAPVGVPVRFRTHNSLGVKFTQSLTPDGAQRVYRWERWNSAALVQEPAMPPQETLSSWLEVSTWPTWESVAGWYHTLAAPRMAITPEITSLAHRLTAGKTTQREKGAAIFYWVEKKTRYVAIEMGLSAYQPHSAGDVSRNRYGDCKDMATLLAALFHAAGIATAWPALLDTENKRPIRDHLASPTLFDHAILRADLDGKPYWFDATAEFCAFGDIPSADRGLEALVVKDGSGTFETIPQGGPEANRTVYSKTVTLHADGSADCQTLVRGVGDSALAARTEISALRPNQLRDHFAGMISGQADAMLRGFTVGGCEDLDKPLTYGVRYTAPTWAARTGTLMIVSEGFAFDSPATLRERRTPFVIEDAQQQDDTVTIHLPPGYRVEAMPDDMQEETAAGTLAVSYAAAPGQILIHKVVTLRPSVISPSAYPPLRAAFEGFAQRLKEPVVLRKVEPDKTASFHE